MGNHHAFVCAEVAQQDPVTGTERDPAVEHEPERVVVVVVKAILATTTANERTYIASCSVRANTFGPPGATSAARTT